MQYKVVIDGKDHLVTFHYNKKSDNLTERRMKHDYISMSNLYSELINGMLEKWNSEYKDEVHGADDPKYNKYMIKKQMPILMAVNKMKRYSNSSIELVLNEKDCGDVLGRNRKDKDLMIIMRLEPMED